MLSGPLVRSSYRAGRLYRQAIEARSKAPGNDAAWSEPMASEKAKELAAKQKAAVKAEKLRKKNSTDPGDWGRVRQCVEAYKQTAKVDPGVTWWMLGVGLGVAAVIAVLGIVSNMIVVAVAPAGAGQRRPRRDDRPHPQGAHGDDQALRGPARFRRGAPSRC